MLKKVASATGREEVKLRGLLRLKVVCALVSFKTLKVVV